MSEVPHIRRRTKLEGHQGSATVEREANYAGETNRERKDLNLPMEELVNPAYVSVGGAVTTSLVQFESIKVSVYVSLPCEATDKAIRKTFDRASSLVEEFMSIEHENATELVKEMKRNERKD